MSARSPRRDPRGAAGLWDLVDYEPCLYCRGKGVWLAATLPPVSRQTRSREPGRGPSASCFLLSWRVAAAGGQRTGRHCPRPRPPLGKFHSKPNQMRAEQLADTVNRVCASRWARRGRLLSSRPPGGALPRGGRGGGTRASEHREATDCAPGTRDQETRQPQPSGARPGRRERHALQRDHALYSAGLHEAPTVRWRPALPGVSVPSPCLEWFP